MKGWKRGKRGIKWWGKREKGDGKHTPFSRRTLVISFTNFFPTSLKRKKKRKKKRKTRGNEGWGDEGEGKEEGGTITQKDGLKQSHKHKYNLMTLQKKKSHLLPLIVYELSVLTSTDFIPCEIADSRALRADCVLNKHGL